MFTDGSYLKGDNGRHCVEYVISASFDVVEAASLPLAASAQQAVPWACNLAKGKIVNIYTNSM